MFLTIFSNIQLHFHEEFSISITIDILHFIHTIYRFVLEVFCNFDFTKQWSIGFHLRYVANLLINLQA